MVAVVTQFVGLFQGMGLSTATVQSKGIDHRQISTLFWLNMSLSAVLAAVIGLLAPVIAWFYRDPRLEPIALALAGVLFVGGITSQHQALLRRRMWFGHLAAIQILGQLFGSGAGIVSAVLGTGYWALVIGMAAETAAVAIGRWLVCNWRPGLPSRNARVFGMVRFGANLTGFRFLNYFSRNADDLLIGKVNGAAALGMYSKAYALLMLPIRQINRPIAAVAVPSLSRLQSEPEDFRRLYYRAVNLVAYLTTPLVVGLAVLSGEVVRMILGVQWLGVVPVFRVLAIAAFLQPLENTAGWVFTSLNQTNRMLRWGLVSAPLTVAAFAIGVLWGPLGVAVAYAITAHALRYPGLWYAYRKSPLDLNGLFRAVWRPVLLSTAMGVCMIVVKAWLHANGQGLIPVVVACLVTGALVFGLGGVVWPSAGREMKAILVLAKEIKPSREPQGSR